MAGSVFPQGLVGCSPSIVLLCSSVGDAASFSCTCPALPYKAGLAGHGQYCGWGVGVGISSVLSAVGAVVKGGVFSPQVVYSTTASVPKVETVKPANNKDDDIDIDAI